MSRVTRMVSPQSMMTSSLLPAGVFALLVVIGVDLVHCVVLASGALLLRELRRLPDVDEGSVWPHQPDRVDDRGVRREVARLSWSLPGFRSRVDRRLMERLGAIADGRLAAYQLDLRRSGDARRIRALLGDDAYATMTAGASSRPSFAQFEHAVSAVERLSDQERSLS